MCQSQEKRQTKETNLRNRISVRKKCWQLIESKHHIFPISFVGFLRRDLISQHLIKQTKGQGDESSIAEGDYKMLRITGRESHIGYIGQLRG